MIGLVISDNMLQMFIFWEMVGLCSYALISFWYKRPESINAGIKVFIMTRIGDICLLAAIGILFMTFGTFSFSGVIKGIQSQAAAGTLNTGLLVIVAFLVLGGAISKSAQLPLFTWLYSAMEAPTSVSALLHAATMVKAGIYLLSRFILIVAVAPAVIAAFQPLWFPTVAWIGILTAFIGATLAITTTDIKGVLAYSTVSQIGFMMAGLGTAVKGAASVGWFASLVPHGQPRLLRRSRIPHRRWHNPRTGYPGHAVYGWVAQSYAYHVSYFGIMIVTTSGFASVRRLLQQRPDHNKRNGRKRDTGNPALRGRCDYLRLLHTHVQLGIHGQRI